MPDGCPWSGFQQPNVDWCEAELCSWITNPADTWSNLAYVLLAVLIWYHARRRGSRTLAMFGPACLVTGLFSFAYHASYTFFLQFFDFVGMFVFTNLVVTLNLRRSGALTARRQVVFYLASIVLFSALVPPMFYLDLPFQGLVAFLILVILVQEIRLWATAERHGAFWLALLLLGAGATCSALDLSRVWCDPHNHWLQGHAVWHVLTALSLYSLYRYFTQFDLDSA